MNSASLPNLKAAKSETPSLPIARARNDGARAGDFSAALNTLMTSPAEPQKPSDSKKAVSEKEPEKKKTSDPAPLFVTASPLFIMSFQANEPASGFSQESADTPSTQLQAPGQPIAGITKPAPEQTTAVAQTTPPSLPLSETPELSPSVVTSTATQLAQQQPAQNESAPEIQPKLPVADAPAPSDFASAPDLAFDTRVSFTNSLENGPMRLPQEKSDFTPPPEIAPSAPMIPAEEPIRLPRYNQDPTGTPAATSAGEMIREEKQNEFAARNEQFLPEPTAISKLVSKTGSRNFRSSDTLEAEPQASFSPHAKPFDSIASQISAQEPAPIDHTLKVERLTQLISNEITLMRNVKPDKLEVVLRPDTDTQIMLHLQMRDGKIDGTAQCERGDFAALNSHWHELQRSLEGQGVRLTLLDEPSTGFGFGQNSSRNPSQSNQQEPAIQLPQMPRAELPAFRPSPLETVVLSNLKNYQLLQTWA